MNTGAQGRQAPDEAARPAERVSFGGEWRFRPQREYVPADEAQVLAILERHRTGHIRVLGALHSWSGAPEAAEVALDLRRFDAVEVLPDAERPRVRVGAGCRLDRLLRTLRDAGLTLPTLGASTRQRIGGALATGTHGSGAPSLSHFVEAVRCAAYDPDTGAARMYEWTAGPELRAARCNLGCMGVVVSVTLTCVARHRVEETVRRSDSLDAGLDDWARFPLQQLVWMPYGWDCLAFQRRRVAGAPGLRGRLNAALYRLYKLVGIDIDLHVVLKFALALPDNADLLRDLYRYLLPRLILRGWTAVDESERMLTLQHHLFRHEEMEVFVPEPRARPALYLVRHIVERFAGEAEPPPPTVAEALRALGLDAELEAQRGRYTHHYPLLLRRVLPDDTLISMSGGDTPWLAIGFFTYLPPARREDFREMAAFVARALVRGFGGRLHWGKHFPLGAAEIAPAYPELERFRAICRRVDPQGVFRNAYTERVLGLAPGPTPLT